MTIPCPSLSTSGWITSPSEKFDSLFSHFYLSDLNQSYLYGNNVANLQGLVEQYSPDITTLTSKIRTVLESYLSRYCDSVTVDVNSNDNIANTTGNIALTLHCLVTDNGVQYSLGRLLNVTNAKITSVINLNNNGAGI